MARVKVWVLRTAGINCDEETVFEVLRSINFELLTLVFKTEKDMRSELFDFAKDNGLKALQINKKIQNLESMFRAMTNDSSV